MTGDIMDTVESKVLARIKNTGKGWYFTPKHFSDLGSNDSVRKALSELAGVGIIKRPAAPG